MDIPHILERGWNRRTAYWALVSVAVGAALRGGIKIGQVIKGDRLTPAPYQTDGFSELTEEDLLTPNLRLIEGLGETAVTQADEAISG